MWIKGKMVTRRKWKLYKKKYCCNDDENLTWQYLVNCCSSQVVVLWGGSGEHPWPSLWTTYPPWHFPDTFPLGRILLWLCYVRKMYKGWMVVGGRRQWQIWTGGKYSVVQKETNRWQKGQEGKTSLYIPGPVACGGALQARWRTWWVSGRLLGLVKCTSYRLHKRWSPPVARCVDKRDIECAAEWEPELNLFLLWRVKDQ